MAILAGAALVASSSAILLTHWKEETAAHVACGAAKLPLGHLANGKPRNSQRVQDERNAAT